MFLSTLTGALVALALVAQASEFGEGFTLFALVILPIVLFIGVTTLIRLGASNYHEAMCVVGMNRIRAAYLEPGGRVSWIGQILAGTPTVVMILNSVLAGVIAAVASLRIGVPVSTALGVGALAFVLAMVLLGLYARGSIAKAQTGYRPLFPTPAADR
ncbi:MAG: hypothetical protein M3O80_07085 [Chloroflexota bacterium]|nr:hypothetical protein [Chloroflexota bacterium]